MSLDSIDELMSFVNDVIGSREELTEGVLMDAGITVFKKRRSRGTISVTFNVTRGYGNNLHIVLSDVARGFGIHALTFSPNQCEFEYDAEEKTLTVKSRDYHFRLSDFEPV